MVVSEMNDRLSPKKAPPTINAMIICRDMSDCEAIPEAIGARATIVPTLVPIDMEMKHAARKRPASMNFPGNILKVRLTVASTLPIDLAVEAKAPAMMNIQIIKSTFLLPAPAEKVPILSDILPGVIITA